MLNYPKLANSKQVNIDSVGGGKCTFLAWNNVNVFDAEIIIIILIHNQANTIYDTLKSSISQEGNENYAILILDDNSMDNWFKSIETLQNNPKLVFAHGFAGKACGLPYQSRNTQTRAEQKRRS